MAAAPAAYKESLDAQSLNTIKSQFSRLMDLANRHDLLRRKLGWILGNDAIDQKLHDIATSGPVVLAPDFSKLKIVGLTRNMAESYVPPVPAVKGSSRPGFETSH